MNYQDQSFDHGQSLGQKSIEEDGKGSNGNDEKRSMPAFEDVSGLVQD